MSPHRTLFAVGVLLALLSCGAAARGEGHLGLLWRTSSDTECPTAPTVDQILRSRVRNAAFRENLLVRAEALGTRDRWVVKLEVQSGIVTIRSTHLAETCHAAAAEALARALLEARNMANGTVAVPSPVALTLLLAPPPPPRNPYFVCFGTRMCNGMGFDLHSGAGYRVYYDATSQDQAAFSYGVTFSKWISNDWGGALVFDGTGVRRPSFTYNVALLHRLLGASPIDPGWRLIVGAGLGLAAELQPELQYLFRPNVLGFLRGEASAGPLVFSAELGMQMSSAWIDVVAVASVGFRATGITEDSNVLR